MHVKYVRNLPQDMYFDPASEVVVLDILHHFQLLYHVCKNMKHELLEEITIILNIISFTHSSFIANIQSLQQGIKKLF